MLVAPQVAVYLRDGPLAGQLRTPAGLLPVYHRGLAFTCDLDLWTFVPATRPKPAAPARAGAAAQQPAPGAPPAGHEQPASGATAAGHEQPDVEPAASSAQPSTGQSNAGDAQTAEQEEEFVMEG